MEPRQETMPLETQHSQLIAPNHRSGSAAAAAAPFGFLCSTHRGAVTHQLIGRSTMVGRLPPCQILMDDTRVSGAHFEIFCTEETRRVSPSNPCAYGAGGPWSSSSAALGASSPSAAAGGGGDWSPHNFIAPYTTTYWVRDLSTNGTFVNHRRVGKGRVCRVKTGDDISVVLLPPLVAAKTNAADESVDGQQHGGMKRERSDTGAAFSRSAASATRSGRESFGHTPERRYVEAFLFHAYANVSRDASPILGPSLWPSTTPPVGAASYRDESFGPGMDHAKGHNNNHTNLLAGIHSHHSNGPQAGVAAATPKTLAAEEREDDTPLSWQWGAPIGKGAQSLVYQAINTANGQMMAVKVLNDLVVEATTTTTTTADAQPQPVAAEGRPPSSSSLAFAERTASSLDDGLRTDRDWFHHNPTTAGGEGVDGTVAAAVTTGCFVYGTDGRAAGGTATTATTTATQPPLPASYIGGLPLDRTNSTLQHRDSTFGRWTITPEQKAELRLLRHLKHRRIVQYYGFTVQDNKVCILLEFVAGGSLQSLIRQFGWFTESVVRIYAIQILQGLEYLHFSGVVHGDIKPENILVTDRGQIKLSDFGTGKILRTKRAAASGGAAASSLGTAEDSQLSWQYARGGAAAAAAAPDTGPDDFTGGAPCGALVGTPLYMSPDMVRTQKATFASDVWAFGCVVLQMASGKPPWSENPQWDNPFTLLYNLSETTVGPSLAALRDEERVVSAELLDFLNRIFVLDAKQRPTASQLLAHPFLGGNSFQKTQPPPPETAAVIAAAAAPPSQQQQQPSPFQDAAHVPRHEETLEDHVKFLRASSTEGGGMPAPPPPPPAAPSRASTSSAQPQQRQPRVMAPPWSRAAEDTTSLSDHSPLAPSSGLTARMREL